MRIELIMKATLSENFAKGGEYGDHFWREINDDHAQGDSRRFVVPAGSTDYEIDLTDLVSTNTVIFLRTSADITLKLGGTGVTGFPVNVVDDDRFGYFLTTGNVTKLYVTTATDPATVIVGFGGDA